jgi:two-component system, NtrC family, response regulator
MGMQKAFLRVLQEKRFRPVGSDREVSSDFRLLAATNRDLGKMVREGTFREDLYFRLRSLEIVLPPLRCRGQDVRTIAEDVAAKTCERLQLPPKTMSGDFVEALAAYPWPGNVRELGQGIECAVVTAGRAATLEPIHLPIQIRIQLARAAVKPELNLSFCRPGGSGGTLAAARDAAVSAYLAQLLEAVRGDMELACEIADVSRSRLYGLLKLYGIGRSAPLNKELESDTMADVSCRFS